MSVSTVDGASRGKPLLTDLWLPALSGLLIGTSYIPFPPWASLFCFVPLWLYWARQASIMGVLLGGFVTAFVFTLIGFNWITFLMHEFVHLPWALAGVAMVLFALLAHLFVPLAGLIWFVGNRRFQWPEPLSLGMMALITILCEAYSPTLFDWNFGYSWFDAGWPLYQWAEVVGFSGLSALTLLANLPLLHAWHWRRSLRGWLLLGAVLGAFIALNLGGGWLKGRLPEPDAHLRVLLVQGNVGNFEKLSAELGRGYQGAILQTYLEETGRALERATQPIDLVVWPETAFPALLGEGLRPDPHAMRLSRFLESQGVPLVTGAYGFDSRSGLLTNSLFVVNAQGQVESPAYSKSILLAFGEYLPGESWFPKLREWLPIAGHFARGPGPTRLLEYNGLRMGPQICYESLFPAFTRGLAERGAQFIINVTNDSWYGAWQEPYQHMTMTLARGVEFRRPVIRATNTGITTVGLADGTILKRSPLLQAWSGLYEVPYVSEPAPTFYQRWFWLVPGLLWSTLAGLLIGGFRFRKREG